MRPPTGVIENPGLVDRIQRNTHLETTRLVGHDGGDLLFGNLGDDSFLALDGHRDGLFGGGGQNHGQWDRGIDKVRNVERRA